MNYYTPIAFVKAQNNVESYREFLIENGYAFNSLYKKNNDFYLMVEVPGGQMEDFIKLLRILSIQQLISSTLPRGQKLTISTITQLFVTVRMW